MNFNSRIRSIERIFRKADLHVEKFRNSSGINCLQGCGNCCMKPDINATVAEFLPFAATIVRQERHLEILEAIDRINDGICVLYNPFNLAGACIEYEHRGLICRLFGFTAKTDKNANRTLVTCKPIKSTLTSEISPKILQKAPLMSEYYMNLLGVEPNLSVSYKPINEAIQSAIEYALMHDHYRKRRA